MPRRDTDELTFENTQVLNLVQAMLGSVSPNMRAISLECEANGIRLCFLLAEDNAADREEIDDIVFEFEVLQRQAVKVTSLITVSDRPDALEMLPGRWVFYRKEDNQLPSPTELTAEDFA